MDLRAHNTIAGKLEEGKTRGWLSDYLVAWHGPSGHLSPNVTVWGAACRSEDELKVYLAGLLTGIVPTDSIFIEAAEGL
jgi:hypothetical protein